FQAEDGIRDFHVTGVQTCALPISPPISEGPVGSTVGHDGSFGCVTNVLKWARRLGVAWSVHHVSGIGTALTVVPFRSSRTRSERSEERRGGEQGRGRWWRAGLNSR